MLNERSPAEFARMVVKDADTWGPKGLAGYNIEVVSLARAYLALKESSRFDIVGTPE